MSEYKLSDINKIIVRNENGSILDNFPLPTRSFDKSENGGGEERKPIASASQWAGWTTHNVLIDRDTKKVPTGCYLEGYCDGELLIKCKWVQREDKPDKRKIEVIEDKVFN